MKNLWVLIGIGIIFWMGIISQFGFAWSCFAMLLSALILIGGFWLLIHKNEK